MLPLLPLVAAALLGFVARCRAGQPREALYLAAFGSGGIVTSWLSRLHVGGFDNVMMYAFAAACVLGPAALAGAGRVRMLVVLVLLLVQFAVLGTIAVARDPARTALPSDAHRRAHAELQAYVASRPDPVFAPAHGGIGRRVGKPASAHGQAIFDLLQVLPKLPNGLLDLGVLADPVRLAGLPPRAQHAITSFRDDVLSALRERRLGAIVLDRQIAPAFEALFAVGLAGADGVPGTADDPYGRRTEPLLTEPAAIRPLFGFVVDSPYALEPRQR
jgi:hypothetical protein